LPITNKKYTQPIRRAEQTVAEQNQTNLHTVKYWATKRKCQF